MSDYPTGTFQNVAVELGLAQPKLVDNLMDEAAVLADMPCCPSTHPAWNMARVAKSVSGGGFRKLNEPSSIMRVSRGLEKVDLGIVGGTMFVSHDDALLLGGKEKAFARDTPTNLKKLGVDADKAVIYDNLRAYALDCGNVIDAGSATNNNYCLLAVRWVEGETTGLYSPEMVHKNENFFEVTPLYGGNLHTNTEGVNGYSVDIRGFLGVQLLNPHSVAGIFNINDDHKPTKDMVNDMLGMVRASPKDTRIYCHYRGMLYLSAVGKGESLRTMSQEKDVNTLIESWNGIKCLMDYNFMDGTEAALSL